MSVTVSTAIARLESEDAAKQLLNAIGYRNAIPMEGCAGCINFTDAMGAGHTATYRISNERYGVCDIVDVKVEREQLYDQTPINQHELLAFLLELEKDPDVETKRQMISRIIEFMCSC